MDNLLDEVDIISKKKNELVEKVQLLERVNDILHITRSRLNKIIFVYSKPKVGSTSLVTSIRMFASHLFMVIHIHDEEMLQVLGNIKNITIKDIISYNQFIGKEVYVIDVYRSPIERKISTFFEKIDSYHFNNVCSEINKYNMDRVINRFNKIFPYIGLGDHFLDTYNIPIPETFDHYAKYLLVEHEGIRYIKLRLKDSGIWDTILSKLLCVNIRIVKDYETVNKPIKECYLQFKENYKIPSNFLEDLEKCKYSNYYYSKEELNEYIEQWSAKKGDIFESFTKDEYNIYEYISLENSHMDTVQSRHYLDEGCTCKACSIKRYKIAQKILKGELVDEVVIHEDAKNELMFNRLERVKKVNQLINVFTKGSAKKKIIDLKNNVGMK